MKSSVIYKVLYWVIRLSQMYTYQCSYSNTFARVSFKIGLKIQGSVTCVPRILIWKGLLLEFYCLSTDGASQEGFALEEGAIRRWDKENMSNFYSYYGKGKVNFNAIRSLLDGLLYFQLLGIT